MFRTLYPLSNGSFQEQADYLELDPESPSYIKNRDKITGIEQAEALVNQEANERADADDNLETLISTKVTTEENARKAADDAEKAAREAADNAEKIAREAADNAEASARETADNEESSAREEADNALDTNKQDKHDTALETTNKDIVSAINEVNNKVSKVYRPCGSVPTYDDLPDDAEPGDVYNVEDTGDNYAYTEEGT